MSSVSQSHAALTERQNIDKSQPKYIYSKKGWREEAGGCGWGNTLQADSGGCDVNKEEGER